MKIMLQSYVFKSLMLRCIYFLILSYIVNNIQSITWSFRSQRKGGRRYHFIPDPCLGKCIGVVEVQIDQKYSLEIIILVYRASHHVLLIFINRLLILKFLNF
jgi:hypothetical protein